MAYKGYLIKVGNYTIPMSVIKAETYKATMNGQDLDSTRDVDGFLHRQALAHTPNKVEFQTVPLMNNIQMSTLLSNIQRQYINATEKKVSVESYVPEIDDYRTEDMYIPDITFELFYADSQIIKYNPTRIAFIGY